jgi:hypothetical protein
MTGCKSTSSHEKRKGPHLDGLLIWSHCHALAQQWGQLAQHFCLEAPDQDMVVQDSIQLVLVPGSPAVTG